MTLYFILQNFLLFSCIFVGITYAKYPQKHWCLFYIILIFTTIEGLRFGRGIDYNLYFTVYENIANGINEGNHEPLFVFMCKILSFIGIPYQGFILICSFILIFNGIYFLKRFPKVLMFSLPLFFIHTLLAENLIRWFLGFSFFLLALKSLSKGIIKKYFIYSILGTCFHFGLIVFIPLFYFFYFFKKEILSPWLILSIYIILTIVWSNSFMLIFSNTINILFSGTERFEQYILSADDWLTGSNKDELIIPLTTHIRLLLSYSFYLFMGKKVIKYEPNLTLYYNIMAIGIMFYPAMNPIELLFRINYVLVMFQFIIAAYCFYYIFKRRIKVNIILRLLSYMALLLTIYNVESQFLENEPHKISYIWDAAGRDYIPISEFRE